MLSVKEVIHSARKRPLRRERLRRLIAVGALLIAVGTIVFDSTKQYLLISQATALSLADVDYQSAPLPPGSHTRHQVIPTFGIDGNWWVLHAEHLIETGQFRTRETTKDNAPQGREVHWSSGIIWYLALGGKMIAGVTGLPITEAIPWAAFFWGPFSLCIFLALWTRFIAARFGMMSASLSTLAICATPGVAELFRFGNCDHHGLAAALSGAGVLTLVISLFPTEKRGNRKTKTARCGKRPGSLLAWSGFWFGCGLWVSAATTLPVIVSSAVGMAFFFITERRHQENTLPASGAFLRWGKAGCLTSLGFYLLEYFPSHMGWRLEVNHPLYAFAWLGGSAFLELLLGKWQKLSFHSFKRWAITVGSLIVISLPVIGITIFSEKAFWVGDRFLLNLHKWNIQEFQPFFEVASTRNPLLVTFQAFFWVVLTISLLVQIVIGEKNSRLYIAGLLPVILPACTMFGMGLVQVRWTGISLLQWITCATLVCGLIERGDIGSALQGIRKRILISFVCLGLLLHPVMVAFSAAATILDPKAIPKEFAPVLITRDVMQRILSSDTSRLPRILCAPTTSTEIVFYSNAEVIGTLYWENMPGLKEAAAIFASLSEEEAKKLILDRGITHILLYSWDEFVREYAALFYDSHGIKPVGNLFLERLLSGIDPPRWLRPLHYGIPASFGMPEHKVTLYQVVADQTEAECLLYTGLYHFDAADYPKAISFFDRGAATDPKDGRFLQLIDFVKDAQSKQKSLLENPTEKQPQ